MEIPSALPTIEEIEGSTDVLGSCGARKTVRVGKLFVVKYGLQVKSLEAENMEYVHRTTKVRVPKVYTCFTDLGTRKTYIIMEHVEGETLATAWERLKDKQKLEVVLELRDSFDEIRQIPPPGYFGSLGKRPLLDGIFWTPNRIPLINGPFETEAALNEAMSLKYVHDDRPRYRADYYRQALPVVFQGHAPTFTHGDCQRKNIIIRRRSDEGASAVEQAESGELEVIIIDWENAGWYPSYWEYSLAVAALRWDDDRCLHLRTVLDPYYAKSSWLQALRLELWS